MITAIPMSDDRVANHFTKADCLVFLDEQGVERNRVDNPARDASCAGKQKLVELLAEQQANRIVVRNIGEQRLTPGPARCVASGGTPGLEVARWAETTRCRTGPASTKR